MYPTANFCYLLFTRIFVNIVLIVGRYLLIIMNNSIQEIIILITLLKIVFGLRNAHLSATNWQDFFRLAASYQQIQSAAAWHSHSQHTSVLGSWAAGTVWSDRVWKTWHLHAEPSERGKECWELAAEYRSVACLVRHTQPIVQFIPVSGCMCCLALLWLVIYLYFIILIENIDFF